MHSLNSPPVVCEYGTVNVKRFLALPGTVLAATQV